jgi:hypothetical protein
MNKRKIRSNRNRRRIRSRHRRIKKGEKGSRSEEQK